MKIKHGVMGILSILLLGATACFGTPADITSKFTCDDFTEHSHLTWDVSGVEAGGKIKATLCANPTTGFQWQLAEIGDVTVIEKTGSAEFKAPEEGLMGAAGEETWAFEALKSGEAQITLEYSQDWEG
ncbi:MAG: protease inhibitor I42 family protein, partial [Dehalococcoidales bacterium]|nr:protease inhibitor I42 family protein [Dehalococcoidales bacterium]